ncbi:EAL and HDOD domain-containing protein [Silvibacterium dinghuense]|uniref:EAL and HDOD domain-containing protein n=1 Tax=Silvibacterium dinghuense TaxID=1560006 RepID=UPI0013E92229|nr:EAL domain-containing protein [Silvibacterium dinghuense]
MSISSSLQAPCAPIGSDYRVGAWHSAEQRAVSDTGKRRYIALQPIFDSKGQVFGYEALCRTTNSKGFTSDPRSATRHVIEDWLLDGLEKLTDGKPVFVNCTREDLLEFFALLPTSTVLEVLETVEVDEWVEDACRKIKAFGHLIALDDFQLHGCNHDLIQLADYIKVDFRQDGKECRKKLLSTLKKRPIQFIAEKVETREELEAALEEGFDLFQGYYLARPILLSKGRSYCSWLNQLRMHWLFKFRWSSHRLSREMKNAKPVPSCQ